MCTVCAWGRGGRHARHDFVLVAVAPFFEFRLDELAAYRVRLPLRGVAHACIPSTPTSLQLRTSILDQLVPRGTGTSLSGWAWVGKGPMTCSPFVFQFVWASLGLRLTGRYVPDGGSPLPTPMHDLQQCVFMRICVGEAVWV